MLKKLRLKFILINMTIVTVLICFLFGLLYYFTSYNLEKESLDMMRTVGMQPSQPLPIPSESGDVRIPYFNIQLNHAGEFAEIDGNFFDLSDNELLTELVQEANNTHQKFGVLESRNLRFLYTETPFGKSIVFADMSSELITLKHLVKTLMLIGIAAFFLFLVVSILLAHWAVKPVEKAWNQQKQFVADASHELKTPLTVIMTGAELLSAPECSESERRQISGSIRTTSERMRNLVEELLSLARMDSGNTKAVFEDCDLSEIVTNAAMTFEPVFFEHDMMLEYEIEDGIRMNGNRAHLEQFPGIFLDNAMKYGSPAGKTTMTLKHSGKHIVLSVANDGAPIPESEIKELFKRFYSADKARSEGHSFGLGLSIAQGIATEHKGQIHVESIGGRNIFTTEFPG